MKTKPIPDFTDYSISKRGTVLNKHGMRLFSYIASKYKVIKLKDDEGVRRTVMIHRAVWSAWKGPIKKGLWVNHKDGDKLNNRLSNLEVGTPSYNHIHARDVLKRKWASGQNNGNYLLSDTAMEAINLLKEHHKWSQHKIAEIFGCSQAAVSKRLKRRNKVKLQKS